MDLPEWIELPLSTHNLIPMDDAAGKLLRMCHVMEVFLGAVAEQLEGKPLKSDRPSDYLKAIRNHLDDVPETDRQNLTYELEVAEQILQIRHGIVHGFWDATLDGVPLEQIRTARWSRKAATWKPLEFNRELLIGAAFRARKVFGFLQARSGAWPDPRDVP